MTDEQKALQYRWYIAGVGVFFVSVGIGQVLNTWLVTVFLHETPERIGFMQMASMLPSTLLLLVGGTVADRRDPRTILIALQTLNLIPITTVAVFYGMDMLGYWIMVAMAVVGSAFAAFIIPARDTMLTNVTRPGQIQKAIATVNMLQFGGQMVGIMFGTRADEFGAIPLLVAQGALILACALMMTRLHPVKRAAQTTTGPRNSAMKDAWEGVMEVVNDRRILTLTLYSLSGGIFYMGAFMVNLPVMVRDVYNGGSLEIGIIQMSFMAGTVIGSMISIRIGPIHRPGRLMMLSSLSAATFLTLIAVGLPFYGTSLCIFAWGLGAGVSMPMTRSVIQLSARPSHRARMLAVFQTTFMGAGPIGALIMGFAISKIGVTQSMIIPPIATLIVFVVVLLFTKIWQMPMPEQRVDDEPDEAAA